MKNKKTNVLKRRSLLAIAFVAVIGFSMTACDPLEEEKEEETISLEGKWTDGAYIYEFRGENFWAFNTPYTRRGTFTYTATHITFYPTHRSYSTVYNNGSSNWEEWTTSMNSSMFTYGGGDPVPYRIGNTKSGTYLYLNNYDVVGYKKQ